METETTLHELYQWTCRVEAEIEELKAAFPEVLAAERNRLIMSIRFLRVALEVRVKARFPKRPGPSPRGTRPQDATHRQSM